MVVLITYPFTGEEVIGAQPTVSEDQHFGPVWVGVSEKVEGGGVGE